MQCDFQIIFYLNSILFDNSMSNHIFYVILTSTCYAHDVFTPGHPNLVMFTNFDSPQAWLHADTDGQAWFFFGAGARAFSS